MDWSNIPSLNALRAFEAAARLGTYSQAARELNVTHAAIAQHVRHLEDYFGQSLMFRNGRQMDVTPEGAELCLTLGKAFGQIENASQKLLHQSKSAPVRITTTTAFASIWLMPRVGQFWQDHPEIELEIIPTEKLLDIRADNIDIAIRYGTGNWPGLEARKLMPAGYMAVAHPDYEIDENANLTDHKLFTYGTGHAEVVQWIRSQGFDLDGDDFTFLPDVLLVRQAALAKRGIAIMTTPAVADDVRDGMLRIVSDQSSEDYAYYVVSRPNVANKSRDVFIKWLVAAAD